MATEQKTPATQEQKGSVAYSVAGQEVKLSYEIVRNFLVRGNGTVTDQELVQFISICKFNQLNPFLNEAYLVKFGGQSETAQMIVSKEALMKRAEVCPEYDGMRAGLILKRGDGIIEVEGSFSLSTDVLLGGWAEVWRRDKKYPYVSRVSLSEYDKNKSTWSGKKSTMIRKTAIVQAMREAFPAQIGALYTAEEQGIQDVACEDVTHRVAAEIAEKANLEVIGFDTAAAEVDRTVTADVITETAAAETKVHTSPVADAGAPQTRAQATQYRTGMQPQPPPQAQQQRTQYGSAGSPQMQTKNRLIGF